MAHILVAGLGDLGGTLAAALADAGYQVSGIRRGDKGPGGVDIYPQDLTEGLPALPPDPVDLVYVILTPDERNEAGYRRAFLEAPSNLLHGLAEQQPLPPVIFVSSIAVYGDSEGSVDENTSPRPSRFNGKVLLAAEEELSLRGMTTSIRFSGIYGRSRGRLLRQVNDIAGGAAPPRPKWTNRIHRDDCVGLLGHLGRNWLEGRMQPPVVVGTDNHPANNREVLNWLGEQTGTPLDLPEGTPEGKQVFSRFITDTGFALRYPDYRAGYGQVLKGPRREA